MKKVIVCALAILCTMSAMARKDKKAKEEGFKFKTVKELPITPIKDQNRSSTCWSFSGVAFLEAELLRMNKGEVDLAEMFIVHHCMMDRAELYVRLHGNATFSPGGSFYDVLFVMDKYGLVPQSAMNGIMYGEELPVHNELDAVARGYVDAIAKNPHSKLTPVWKQGLEAVYNTYLGECPEKFAVDGKDMTPKTYADELGLKKEDYISLTSYTHHPFYSSFSIEIEDNWRNGQSYNLPIDELMEVMRNAINTGYTFAWGADVSELGFSRDGIAVVPDNAKAAELSGSDMARWTGMSAVDKRAELTSKPLPEMDITQDMRQIAFNNWTTTDDHGMLIYGIAKDQNDKPYFLMKNSWGTEGKYKGIWYVSEAFAKYKTMNILVHKDAVPAHIMKKLMK